MPEQISPFSIVLDFIEQMEHLSNDNNPAL